MKIVFFSLFSLLLCLKGLSQNKHIIDSLYEIISNIEKQCPEPCYNDTSRINAYILLFEETYSWNPDSALYALQKAKEVADDLLAKNLSSRVTYIANKQLATTLNNIGYVYENLGNSNKSISYFQQSLSIRKKIEDKKGIAETLNNIGANYHKRGNILKAMEYLNKSLVIREEIGNQQEIAQSFYNIGYIYNIQGKIIKSLEYYHKCLNIYKELGDKKREAISLNNIGLIHKQQGDFDKALKYFINSLDIHKSIGFYDGIATIYHNIGGIFYDKGNINRALEYYNKSLSIRERIGNKQGIAITLNKIGSAYERQGNISKALDCYNKSLNIYEKIGDQRGISNSFNNLAGIYSNYNDISKALDYYNKSFRIRENIGYKKGVANSLNQIGYIYQKQRDFTKALDYFNKSFTIYKEMDNKIGMGDLYNNLGALYHEQGDLSKALEYYHKSLNIREKIGNKEGLATTLYNLGRIYQQQNHLKFFKKYAVKSYNISKELGFIQNIQNSASLMKDFYILQGNYIKAFEYYQEEILMRDSIQKAENYKKAMKHEYEKQKAIDSIEYAKAMEIKEIQLVNSEKQKQKQKNFIKSLIIGIVILIILIIIILLKNKKIKLQKEKLYQQNEIVEKQKKEIEDSIEYAKRIQIALLPNQNRVNSILGEHFIFFRPKDIVSGDFYWTTKVNNLLIVTVADCTGHGVSGAFMSMLGISYLNEIVRKKEETNAANILKSLRSSLVDALNQTEEESLQKQSESQIKDGMDMCLIVLDINNNQCQCAGANNPLWVMRNNSLKKNSNWEKNIENILEVIKPDRMPIAQYDKMDDFNNKEIQLETGDRLFLFSDGFSDQFGGPQGKKLKSKAFKRLIIKTSTLSMKEQKEEIKNEFENWINYNGQKYEQIDDITVLGLKIQ